MHPYRVGFVVMAFLLCLSANAQTPDANGIVYVTENGTGNGSSWADATSDLHNAIHASGVTQVFVATGNYNVGANSFVMKNNVEIYGGFDPDNGITDLTHDRILPSSGGVGGGGSVLNGQNTRPVVWNVFTSGTALNTSAVLDGFTVMNGLGNTDGGGIRNIYASPTLRNLVVKNNSLSSTFDTYGGGIFNGAYCSPVITNVIIKGNTAKFGGGLFTNGNTCEPVLTNVLIVDNIGTLASQYGGAYESGKATYTNVTIAGNTAKQLYVNNSNTQLNNVIVWGANTGGISTGIIQNSLISGFTGTANGNIDATGITETDIFTNPSTGDYTLKNGSPAVNAGNNAFNSTSLDLAGNPRIYNSGIIDLGAYESEYSSPVSPDAQNTLYVNINVTGGNGSGDSWENAIPQLADALKYARQQYVANTAVYDVIPLKIYVAKGTYKPLYSARNNYFTQTGSADPAYSDQDNAFVMVKNVQIYGGFDPENGIDDLTDTRIFGSNGSILSGDIGDIYDINYPYINANHVVIASGDVGNAVLNGFTITRAFSESTNAFLTVFIYPVQNAFGAMYCVRSSPTVENCIFTDNSTSGGNMFNYQQSSPTIINCTFINNGTMGSGGAIYNSTGSSPTITNCSFTGNSAYGKGGAIYNSTNSNPIITNCSFTDNSSRSNGGGAIYNIASSPIITNSLFANNKSRNSSNILIDGGAIYNESTSSPVFTNVTIADNLGATTVYSTGTGSTTFHNSIVFGTVSATYTAQYSLIEGNAGGPNGNLNGTIITKADVFTDNTNGDYSLFPCSAVANSGNNSLFAGLDENTQDLAGNARVYDYNSGGVIDLGAYESQPVIPDANGVVYVTATGAGTRNGSSWSNATSKLQCAIDATGTQKVFVATGNYSVGSSSFIMKNNVEIYGGFDPDNGITDLSHTRILPSPSGGDGGGLGSVLNGLNTRPLIWNFNGNLNNSAVLDGFTLKNGSSASGGAMYNGGSSPTLRNLWIKENTATADGGAIYNVNSSSPEMTNITIEGNTASYGGGIFNRNSSSPVMTNVTIKNNTANNDGGGMYNDNTASPVMTNVSITENTAQNGAGMYNRTNSSPVLVNTLIADNTAVTNGGAIRNEATSSPQLVNVTIVNNTGSNALYATDGNTVIDNSIVFGTVTGSYTAQYSMIQNSSSTDNGNMDMTGITTNDVLNGDYTLKNTSLAVNTGNNMLFTGLNANTKDLAGNPRVYEFANEGVIDMGAYEHQSGCFSATRWNGTAWSNGIPNLTKKVIIDGDLTLTTDVTACELLLNSGVLTVNPDVSLTVNGEVVNTQNANNFIVQNNANLIQVDDVENTGAITVERNAVIKHLDYTIWSSPVMAQDLQEFSPQTLPNRIRIYNESTDTWSVTSGDFASGRGYMFRAPNVFDAPYPNVYTWTGTFSGVPENGTVTASFNAGDYQSLGNPYPSNIDREVFHTANPNVGTLYFWTNTNPYSSVLGDYTGSNWTTINRMGDMVSPDNSSNVSNGIILVGQGFVAETDGIIDEVVFDNSMRTSQSGTFFRTMQNENHRLWLNLTSENQNHNQILVGYSDEATNAEDFGIDSKMFDYSGSAIYSLMENNQNQYTIQGRTLPFDDNDIVLLGFRAINAGVYTVSLSNFDGLFSEGQDIFIKDNFTQTQHNLKDGAYTFVSENGTFEGRFELVFREGTMSTTTPDLSQNWVVYKQDNNFRIETQGFEMSEVTVYDILGRTVYEATNINASNHTFPTVNANQMLIVKILSTENQRLTKKVKN